MIFHWEDEWRAMFRLAFILFGNAVLLYSLTCTNVNAQTKEHTDQIWLAGQVVYNTKSNFIINGELEYQGEYQSENDWKNWIAGVEVGYLLIPTLELRGELKGLLTNENDTLSRKELRPVLSAKWDFLNRGRFILYDHLKFEWRQLYFSSSELNSGSLRVRNKLGMIMALTQKSPTMNKSLNLLVSLEAFLVEQDNERERFSNRIRLECGLSYRLSDQWKLIMSYYRQHSRNQIEESFSSHENILSLKATYYL